MSDEKRRTIALERIVRVDSVAELVEHGSSIGSAIEHVARDASIPERTLRRWYESCRRAPRAEWSNVLTPKWKAPERSAPCHPAVYDFFRDDYLRPSKPTYAACYRRAVTTAAANGWEPVPSLAALVRRLEKEIPATTIVFRREGREALERIYPAQQRTRAHFHALYAVNADGHKVDVFVRWPGVKEPVRVMMMAFQDLHSGKILAWRVDRSENADLVRLTFADLVERWGVPEHAYLDNGRGFASKWLTGRAQYRFRYKVRAEEPAGVLTQMGVRVHWTTPYHGQSKPIERAFLDLCENVARHPAFEGAYTGRNPVEKPANYGARAVELDEFLRVLDAQVKEHNARVGRESEVCAGRSFDQVFAESYAASAIRKASAEQSRLMLLAAEGVPVRADTSIHLGGNRYWSDALIGLRGELAVVRFDPHALKRGLYVYRLDGAFVGFAECIQAVGFDDTQAAKEHAKRRREWTKAQAKAARIEQTFTPYELAALHLKAQGAAEPPPSAKVIKPLFRAIATPPASSAVAIGPTADEQAKRRERDEFIDELGEVLRERARERSGT